MLGTVLLQCHRKLADRIWRWEFVDMGELLPEFLAAAKVKDPAARHPVARRPRKVTDIETQNQRVTRHTIQIKALEIHDQSDAACDFVASRGWLEKFSTVTVSPYVDEHQLHRGYQETLFPRSCHL